MKQLLIILCLLTGWISLVGQNAQSADPYLYVVEVATNSRVQDTIHGAQGIADHESEIHIHLNRAEIEERILIMQGASRSDQRLQTLRRLNTLLDMQIEIQSRVNEVIKLDQSGQEKPFDKLRELAALENEALAIVNADPDLRSIVLDREMEYAMQAIDDPTATYIGFVFDILGEEATKLRESFLEDLGLDAQNDSSLMVYFRLGAFVRNKQGGYPVHVENFDTYSPQEYNQSSIFSQPVSEEEKQALSENVLAGKKLQQELQNGQLRFQELFQANEEPFASKSTYDSLRQTIHQKIMATTSDTSAKNILFRANLDLQQVLITYNLLQNAYSSLSTGFSPGSTPVRQLQSGLNEVIGLVDSAYQKYDQELQRYKTSLSDATASPGMEALDEVDLLFADYRSSVKQEVSQVSSLLSKAIGVLNPLKKNSLDSEEFTDQVKRFTIGSLPAEGIITLRTTGARPGEDIVIRAVLQRGRGPRDRYFEEEVLSRRVIRLERVSAHIKMSGSLILANPYTPTMTSDTIALANRFQFAPSYTIFMSWGSRKSHFYNQYIGLGLGLGFSSPDFNLDGTPEFGVSVMGTVFQDIISAGWGWNFGVDTPYWYVGFNIPFTVGGIPNLGSSQAIR